MSRILIASLAAFSLLSGSAMAADMALPYKAPPPPAANWTGCYLDGGAGYGMWNADHYMETYPDLEAIEVSTTSGGRGWLGTVGGGCDYQFRAFNNWDVVIGAFGDYDFMGLSGTASDPFFQLQGNENESGAWAAGLRLGLLVTPTLLTYIDGGYTGAHFDQINLSFTDGTASGFAIPAHDYQGWFIGGGTEYALTFLPIPGLFWRNEYRFSTYNADDIQPILAATGTPLLGLADHTDKTVQTITSSLVWRFNWAGPLAARD